MSTFMRLLPYNPKMGALVQRYTYRSMTFRGGRRPHWYEIKDQALVRELGALKQDQYDPRSLPLFECMEESEKLATEKRETDQFLAAMGAVKETLSIAPALKHPPTHAVEISNEAKTPRGPITTAAVRRDDEALGGRASALPPLRDDQLVDASVPPTSIEVTERKPASVPDVTEEPRTVYIEPDPAAGDDSVED